MRRDRPDCGIAHGVEDIVVGHIARPDELDAGLSKTALRELLHDRCTLTGGDEDEQRVRLGVLGALNEGRIVRVLDGHPRLADDLAAVCLEHVLERRLGVDTRRVVGHQGEDLLDAVLRGPNRDEGPCSAAA